MAKEISASEYERLVSSGKTPSSGPAPGVSSRTVATVAVVIILCGLNFLGGIQYQKGHGPKAANGQAAGGFQGRGGFGSGQRPTIGTVTAVSGTSLTIKNSRTGASQTFTINSATTISNNGATASASDIQTGDTVFVQASSSDATTASRIMLNPSFGGQGGADGGDSSGGTTQQ